jgi:competence protein ComEA
MFKKTFIAALLALLSAVAIAAGVDINKANQAELESVKGIGPAMATRMLNERKKGEFKDWTDLMGRVKGVKDHQAAKLSEAGLTINGGAYKASDAKPQPKK